MSIIRRFRPEEKDTLSRYNDLDRIVYDTGETLIETPNRIEIPQSSNDIYHKVTVEEENRLDLISHKYYNTPLLWWVIAAASGITNPLQIKVGTVLRIPDFTTIYGPGGVVK